LPLERKLLKNIADKFDSGENKNKLKSGVEREPGSWQFDCVGLNQNCPSFFNENEYEILYKI